MKFKNLYYLLIIFYLISSSFAYSIEAPNIKNLIIHKNKKKIENLEFINSKSQKVNLSDFKSNIIIINFWATWCAPCRKEMPSLDKLSLNKNLNEISILALNIGGETFEKSKKFFNELKIKNLEIYFGSKIELSSNFKIRGIPTTIFIDRNGYEFARVVGYIDFENNEFLKWLNNYQ